MASKNYTHEDFICAHCCLFTLSNGNNFQFSHKKSHTLAMDHMEFSIALPPYVEFTNAGIEWANMKQRLVAHGNHSSDTHRHHNGLVRAFLINIAADQVQEVFNMFALSYDETAKFSRILQHLEDICVPRLLIIYNRYKFFTCKQTYSDKFDDFLRDLLNWSDNCEFGDLKDILLKDCIITGIPDNSIRQRLLETEELDFAKTVEICRAVEKWRRVRNVLVSTNPVTFCDASVSTENTEESSTESRQNREPVKEHCSVLTDPVVCSVNTSITKEQCAASSIKDVGVTSVHESSLESKENVSSGGALCLLTSARNGNTGKFCKNSEVENISKQTESLKVLRRSLRHKKVTDISDTEHVRKKTESHKYEIKSDSSGKLNISNYDHETVSEIKIRPDEENSLARNTEMPGTDLEMSRAVVFGNKVQNGNQKKLKCLKIDKTEENSQTVSLKNKCGLSTSNRKADVSQKDLFCSFCGQSFSDKILLLSHLRKMHGKKHVRKLGQKCRVCKAVFVDLVALRKHKLVHKNEKKLTCDFCPARFGNPSHLKVHMRLHTGERPYTCDTCGASYPEASKLKAHIRKHTGEKPYRCSVCSRTFAWRAAYSRHMRTHTGERPYTCEFCGVNFADFTSLQRHIRTHTLEKPYCCEKCSAKFTDPSALKLHNRIHNGERPYVCGTCGTAFIRSQHLKEHFKLHTGEKPFKCETCDARFAEASKLKSHCRKHTGEKPYLCKICGTRFAWTAAFTRHMRTHTMEKPYVCDFCGSHYADHSTLTRHRRTHTGERPYLCKICGKYFADNSSLHRHMRIHTGEKSYTCEVCGSSFAVKSYLVRHMRTHTGEKPYGCDLCGSKFTDSSKLNRHKKIHFKAEVNQERQGKSEMPQYQQQLHPVQQFSTSKAELQQPVNEKPDQQTSDQQQPLLSVVHNLPNPILLSTPLLPLNNGLPFTSSVFS